MRKPYATMISKLYAHLTIALTPAGGKLPGSLPRTIHNAVCNRAGSGGLAPPRLISQRRMIIILTVLASANTLVSCISAPATSPAIAPPQQEIPKTVSLPTETPGPVESAPSDGSTPITVRLILSKAPQLNEPADLVFIVSSVLDAPGTIATILLPDGAVLIDGDLEWSGDLLKNEPLALRSRIKFVKEGNLTVEAKALCSLENGDVWGDAAYIYLYVSKEAGHFGFPTEPPLRSIDGEVPSPSPVDPSP